MGDESLTIYLAPLRGVTLRTYRNAFQRHFGGLDLAISPFIPTVNCIKVKPSLLKDVDLEREQLLPTIPQIIGNRPEDVVNMYRALKGTGHEEVNWNLGCPHRPVTRKKRGSGLLPHPEMIKAVLDRVFEEEDVKFSVKVRLGLNDPDELFSLIDMFNEYPLTEVIIHPRTGSQLYRGTVDVDRFAGCLERLVHPVVYNGDICCVSDYRRLHERFPSLDRWMIGRGLIANPFLAEQIKGINLSGTGPVERISSFLSELLDVYSGELFGPAHIIGRMKELWKYLAHSFEGGSEMLSRIQRCRSVDEYTRLVDELLCDGRLLDFPGEEK